MTQDRISALFFLAISIAYGMLATDIRVPAFAAQGVTARTLPYVLAGTGAVIAIMMLVMPSKEQPAQSEPAAVDAQWVLDFARLTGLSFVTEADAEPIAASIGPQKTQLAAARKLLESVVEPPVRPVL